MKKKLNIQLCVVGAISIFLTAILTVLVFYHAFQQQVFSDLKVYTDLYKESVLEDSDLKQLSNLKVPEIRVTLIEKDGTVLYDSTTDASSMDNHSNRPEVEEALNKGTGSIVRLSDTIGTNTFYYAVRLEDGRILRVGKDANSIVSMIVGSIPSVFIVAILLFVLCLILARIFTESIIQPIERMARHINEIEDYVAFEELVPFAKTIQEQHNNISEQMEALATENMKMEMITNHMEEGLLLLDQNKCVVIANKSARKMLNTKSNHVRGQNVVMVSRNEPFLQCIEKACNQEKKSVTFGVENRQIRAYANPVLREGEVVGVLCLLIDMTESIVNEKMRQEFTANVSHELKTPLAAISGYAELIESGIAKEEDVVRFATEIHQSATRLLQLINDIIKLSQLDESDGKGEFVSLDLYQVAKQCEKLLEHSADKHHIQLAVSGEKSMIQGVPTMVEELVFNLMDNAIRYNTKDGSVSVQVNPTEDGVQIEVKDTGIGIPKKYQERIFERFFRVDKSRSKETGGTGLGLAIVKHIAMWHEAKIVLDSEEGTGTRIRIEFPKDEMEM